MSDSQWPPRGTEHVNYFLGRKSLDPNKYKDSKENFDKFEFTPCLPLSSILNQLEYMSTYDYDPRNPCPSIG